jgi:cytochrome c peroxidase
MSRRFTAGFARGFVGLLVVACGRGGTGGPLANGTAAANPRATAARAAWVATIDTLQLALGRLDSAAVAMNATPASVDAMRARFRDARLAYKRVEHIAAYYQPSTVRLMNGPALPRVDDEEGPEAVYEPEGFQVIEEILFSDQNPTRRERLLSEIANLGELTTRLRTAIAHQAATDDRVWDAVKLEIARVLTMGISGFDSPVAQLSLPEAAAALRGVRTALQPYDADLARASGRDKRALDSTFAGAIAELDAAASFDEFNRLSFIARWGNPIAHSLASARRQLQIGIPTERRAFATSAASIFDRDAFDAQAFAPPAADRDTPSRATLGERLFFEARLSGNNSRSCATCHQPARAFTDGQARSASIGGPVALRNAPTVLNAGLQVGSFYDLRTTFLEDQVTEVVRNPNEMHGSVDVAARTLASDSGYRATFAAAFGERGDSTVTSARIRSAIAAYVRSLSRLNSPADRALRGDTLAISAEQRLGFNLFMGKAKCGTCHFAPLFNGTAPPNYQETDVEVLGTPARTGANARIDPDSGRFRLTRAAPHLFAFKTPSVRNAAVTAPYMHNGVFRTLDEVVAFYDQGGGAGLGIDLPNQTLPPDRLNLTAAERQAIVAFMRALTDTTAR